MLNILIVCDEITVRDNFSKFLRTKGFNVTEALSGSDGVKLAEKQDLDLVFVCSRLQDLDGVRVLELINKKKRDLDVVICCEMGDLEVAVQAVKAGAYDFIEEPYKNSDIMKIAREILSKNKKGNLEEFLKQEKQNNSKDQNLKAKYIGIGLAVFIILGISIGIFEFNKNYSVKEKVVVSSVNAENTEGIAKTEKQADAPKIEKPVKKDVVTEKKIEYVAVPAAPAEKTYAINYSHPSGVHRSGDYLWVCDWFTQSIYKHKLDESMTLVKTYSVGDLHPSGLAIINGFLWVSDSWDGTVTKFKIDNDLVVVKTYKVAAQAPSGLMFDGASIWLCDTAAKKISKHWMDNDLTMSFSAPSPGEAPVVLSWDGSNVISGDRDAGMLYFHKSPSNLLEVEKYQNELLKAKKGKFSGFTSDKDYFWMVFDGTGSIYRLKKTR